MLLPELPELADARDVAPSNVVDAIVGAVRYELATLEDLLRRAEADADELERLATEVALGDEDQAALVRAAAFLDLATAGAQVRRQAAVDAARVEAEARVEDARADAELLLLGVPEPSSGPRPPLALLANEQRAEGAPDVIDQVDLSGLPNLKAVLETMLAVGDGAVASEVIAPVDSATSDDPSAGVLPDGDEPFQAFWEAAPPAPAEPVRWWSALPVVALLPLVAIVVLVALFLLLIG